jgi:hypothetical protein
MNEPEQPLYPPDDHPIGSRKALLQSIKMQEAAKAETERLEQLEEEAREDDDDD